MKQIDRIVFYIIGFTIGTILISGYLQYKENQKAEKRSEQAELSALQTNPLPNSVPDVFLEGTLLDYSEVQTEMRNERIWLLQFKKSYPYIRIVEDLETGLIEIMAADQIMLYLNDGVDVTDLKEELDAHNLKVRMFNRNQNIVVVGVLNKGVDAVPMTLNLVSNWSEWVLQAVPDYIQVQAGKGN